MTLTKKDVEQIMKWKDEINKVGGGIANMRGIRCGQPELESLLWMDSK